MKRLSWAIPPVEIVLMMAASDVSATPLYLRRHGNREVANITAGAHISYQDVEYLKIDPETHFFAEAGRSSGPWTNACNLIGADCRFSEKMFAMSTGQSPMKLSMSVDRVKRRFNRQSDNGIQMSLTEGWCDEMSAPDAAAIRRF